MKITAPFDRVEEVKPLIEAGADELYCGVCSNYWKFRGFSPNDRLGFCSLSSFRQLKEALGIAKSYHIPIFLCFNTYFNKETFESALKEISLAIESGIDGFVIADLGLIPFIKKLNNNCKIVLSCLNTCFNSKTLDFFKELGVDRVILDRQLTLKEIEYLSIDAKKLQVELEVFIHNIVCRHINANCLVHRLEIGNIHRKSKLRLCLRHMPFMKGFRHFIERNKFTRFVFTDLRMGFETCRYEFKAKVLKIIDQGFIEEKILGHFSLDAHLPRYCAVCSMYYLERYGIAGVKIIGRGFLTPKKVQDVKFTRRYLEEIKNGSISEYNYLFRGRSLYREVYGRDCVDKECHHWEVYQQRQKLKEAL